MKNGKEMTYIKVELSVLKQNHIEESSRKWLSEGEGGGNSG
jgi:hypothetical protein